jgi:hypothetical protein
MAAQQGGGAMTIRLPVEPAPTTTPFSRTVIVGSNNFISAPSSQTLGGVTYVFSSWSDGGAQNHDIIAGAQPSTYTATYNSATSQCTITGTSATEILTGTSGPTSSVVAGQRYHKGS